MNTRIKISSLMISIMCLLLITTPYISQRNNNIIKLIIEVFLLLIIINQKKITKSIIKNCIPIFLFLLFSLIATYRWSGFSTRLLNNIVTIGSYFLFFAIIHMSSFKMKNKEITKLIRTNIILYSIIIDFFVLITLGKGLGGLNEPVYLLGNKFVVSYLHMFVLALLSYDYSKYDKIIRYFLYSLFILFLADTTTGIVGVSVIFVLTLIMKKDGKLIEIISKPKIAVLFFLAINAIFLLSSKLYEIDFIYNFLLNKSHTSSLLSGRLVMYKLVMKTIIKSPIWGYGFNYDIVNYTLGFGNPQNGILKLLLDFGIVGTSLFIFVIYTSFKKICEFNDNQIKKSIIIFIYAMMICSLVEINLSALFMLAIAMSNIYENNNENSKSKC